MKARVKATGRIIQVMNVMDEKGNGVWEEISDMTNLAPQYSYDELEFLDIPKGMQKEKSAEPDYWEKLKHQYAGMAMQGILSNPDIELDFEGNEACVQAVAQVSIKLATALVNKLKEESQCEK